MSTRKDLVTGAHDSAPRDSTPHVRVPLRSVDSTSSSVGPTTPIRLFEEFRKVHAAAQQDSAQRNVDREQDIASQIGNDILEKIISGNKNNSAVKAAIAILLIKNSLQPILASDQAVTVTPLMKASKRTDDVGSFARDALWVLKAYNAPDATVRADHTFYDADVEPYDTDVERDTDETPSQIALAEFVECLREANDIASADTQRLAPLIDAADAQELLLNSGDDVVEMRAGISLLVTKENEGIPVSTEALDAMGVIAARNIDDGYPYPLSAFARDEWQRITGIRRDLQAKLDAGR
jgi:hypothetical protein